MVMAAPTPAGPLTLAEAFLLMQRALGELPAPAPHEKLRARMVALLGREDPLLESGRFLRFLRQANDAEAADVRKLDGDAYEISPHRVQLALEKREKGEKGEKGEKDGKGAPEGRDSVMAERETPATAIPESPASVESRTARALRFRRGSRGPLRPTEVALVGVVRMDDEPAAKREAEDTKPSRRPRRGRATPAKAQPKPKPEAAATTSPRGSEATAPPRASAGTVAVAASAAKKPSRRRGRAGPKKESRE